RVLHFLDFRDLDGRLQLRIWKILEQVALGGLGVRFDDMEVLVELLAVVARHEDVKLLHAAASFVSAIDRRPAPPGLRPPGAPNPAAELYTEDLEVTRICTVPQEGCRGRLRGPSGRGDGRPVRSRGTRSPRRGGRPGSRRRA